MLVTSLALQQVKEVGTVTQKEVNTEYENLTYISLALTIFGLVMVAILHYRISKYAEEAYSENNDIHFRCMVLCTHKSM